MADGEEEKPNIAAAEGKLNLRVRSQVTSR